MQAHSTHGDVVFPGNYYTVRLHGGAHQRSSGTDYQCTWSPSGCSCTCSGRCSGPACRTRGSSRPLRSSTSCSSRRCKSRSTRRSWTGCGSCTRSRSGRSARQCCGSSTSCCHRRRRGRRCRLCSRTGARTSRGSCASTTGLQHETARSAHAVAIILVPPPTQRYSTDAVAEGAEGVSGELRYHVQHGMRVRRTTGGVVSVALVVPGAVATVVRARAAV